MNETTTTKKDILSAVAVLVQHLESKNAEIKRFVEELKALPKPVPPVYVESSEQWEKYTADVTDYEQEVSDLNPLIDFARSEKSSIEGEISKLLPDKIWFRVLTTDGERWVGVINTWVYIKKERPATSLEEIQ